MRQLRPLLVEEQTPCFRALLTVTVPAEPYAVERVVVAASDLRDMVVEREVHRARGLSASVAAGVCALAPLPRPWSLPQLVVRDVMQLIAMFPDEAVATACSEALVRPHGRHCPRCGCTETREAAATAGRPDCYAGCLKPFSVKIGTALERSRVTMRQWVFAIYLEMTSLKGVSSMKLHRDLGVTQKTAWFMLHRIREAWGGLKETFGGPIEADETCMGGCRANMSRAKRKELADTVGKTAVAGVRDRATNDVRAEVVVDTTGATLQGFVRQHAAPGAKVCMDDAIACAGLVADFEHEAVNHSVAEYVRGQAHMNGMESFRSMLKRAHKGVCHKLSAKHLDRHVREFAGRHNVRELDMLEQMGAVVIGMVGKRFMYRQPVADDGLPSGARPNG